MENSNYDGLVECPYCHYRVKPLDEGDISTGGIVMVILGILIEGFTMVITKEVFSPALIVCVVLVIFGLFLRDNTKVCPNCKMRIN